MDAVPQILSVCFVLGLLFLVAYVLRKKGSGLPLNFRRRLSPGDRKLEGAARLVLTPQHALHLVRFDGREILVATHPQGCTMLAENRASQTGVGA